MGVSHAAKALPPWVEDPFLCTSAASISQLPLGAYIVVERPSGIAGAEELHKEPWKPRLAATWQNIGFTPSVPARGDITTDVSAHSSRSAQEIADSQVSMFGPDQAFYD